MKSKFLSTNLKFLLTAASLCALSTFLHFYKITSVPPGMFVDEAAGLYNSYSILETGADQHGKQFPMHFKALGTYMPCLGIYLTVPLIWLFGFSIQVPRIMNSLFAILASVAIYYLLRSMTRQKYLCLGGAFTFSVLPWIFPLSRCAFEFPVMLFFYIVGWAGMKWMLSNRSCIPPIIAGVSMGILFYSYHLGKIAPPIMIVLFIATYNRHLLKIPRNTILLIATYMLTLLPGIYVTITSPEVLNRFYSVNILGSSNGTASIVSEMPHRYIQYFCPDFLFFTGDGTPRHNIGMGELYIFLIIPLVLGIYITIKTFCRNPHSRFLVLNLLLYPAAAIITTGEINCTRTMSGSVLWTVLAVVGLIHMWRYRKRYERILLATLVFASIEIPYYFYNYFNIYPGRPEVRFAFLAPYTEAFEAALSAIGENETLYISRTISVIPQNIRDFDRKLMNDFYIYYLVYSRFPPSLYISEGISPERFCIYECGTSRPGILITSDSSVIIRTDGQLELHKNTGANPDGAKLLKELMVNPSKKLLVIRLGSPSMEKFNPSEKSLEIIEAGQ